MNKIDDVLKKSNNIAYYGRVSTKRQSIDNQRDNVRNFLKKHGITNIRNFEDKKSAYKKSFDQRDSLSKLIKAAKNKEIDSIIVSAEDRLTRQPKEHHLLRKLFQDLNVPVIISSKGEFYNADDLIKNLVIDGLSRYEAETTAMRTHHAMQQIIRNNGWTGGNPPFGFAKVKNEAGNVVAFEPVSKDSEIVKKIYRAFQTGETLNGISKALEREYSEINWSPNKIKSILSNPFYTGHMVYNRKKGKNGGYTLSDRKEWTWVQLSMIKDPPITIEDWNYCWERLQNLRNKAPKFINTTFYFNQILRCNCGHDMVGKDQRTTGKNGKVYGDRWYICRNCSVKVRADEFHDLFIKYFDNSWLYREEMINELKNKLSLEIQALEKEYQKSGQVISELKKELEELTEIKRNIKSEEVYLHDIGNYNPIHLACLITIEEIKEKIENLKEERERLEKQILRQKELVRNPQYWSKIVKELSKKGIEGYSNKNIRSIILLLIKNCTFSAPNKISFTFSHLPQKGFTVTS